jgi:tetratricopeptide (TPR) repeat protein
MFSGYGVDPHMQSVLFEIEVGVIVSTVKRPFALISHISTKPGESEFLFSVGSMFRIESLADRRSIEGYWHVKLKLVEDDSDINELKMELEKEHCDESDLSSLGSVLIVMGDYKRAERYFLILLEYLPADHPATYRIYSCLGKIAHNKGDHTTSLDYHEKALEYLKKPGIYNTQENIGQVYADSGSSYHGLGKLDLAMKYLTMATDLQTSPKLLSHTYNQIGLVYRDKGDKRLALEYFLKALHIEEQILKTNQYQPALATSYNNIGEIYSQLGDYENALKYLHHALDIRLKGTVSTHTDLAAIYNNLGVVYHKKRELKKALEAYEKALEIDIQALGNDHESIAVSHNNISAVYCEMGDLARALYHLETALRILLHSQAGEDHVSIATSQYNIGMLQLALGNSMKALKITHKALQNQLKILPENHERLAHTYFLLSKIYEKQQNKSTALEYMEKAVKVARISILPNNKDEYEVFQSQLDLLKNVQFNDGERFQQTGTNVCYTPDNPDLQDCLLSNYSEELTQTSSDDILKRLQLLDKIGSIHSKKENYPMAMKCFNEAIEIYIQNQTSNRFLPQELERPMALIYFSISRVYYRQENWTMSLNYLEQALDVALKQTGEYLLLGETYHAMGLSYGHKRDVPMALYYFELAISTAKKGLPDDHPRVQVFYHNLRQWQRLDNSRQMK